MDFLHFELIMKLRVSDKLDRYDTVRLGGKYFDSKTIKDVIMDIKFSAMMISTGMNDQAITDTQKIIFELLINDSLLWWEDE